MADQAHAMGKEIGEPRRRLRLQRRLARRNQVPAQHSRRDPGKGRLLHRLDLGQQIDQFRIRLAQHGHAAQIPDIAAIIAARIHRHHLARLPGLHRSGPVVAGPQRQQAIVEMQAPLRLLAAQLLDDPVLGPALAGGGHRGHHRIRDQFRRLPQQVQLCRGLDRPHLFQHARRIRQPVRPQRPGQHLPGIGRQEAGFDPDPPLRRTDLFQMRHRRLRRIHAAPAGGQDGGRPERMVGMLAPFHPVADIGRRFRPAAPVHHHRQVAAVPDGIHRAEEDEPVSAQQILHIVLRGDDERIKPRLVHQPVNARQIRRKILGGVGQRHIHSGQPLGVSVRPGASSRCRQARPDTAPARPDACLRSHP